MRRTLPEKKEYFSGLYDQSFDYVYSYIFARTAGNGRLTEEIVQDTFAAAWQALDGFKAESSFKTWVCSIAKNKLRENYRKSARKEANELHDEDVVDRTRDGTDTEKEVLGKETRGTVLKALSGLPELYRYSLIMKYMDGFSVKEIAKVLGKTPKAVDGILQRARAAFEKKYENLEGSDLNHEG